MAVEQQSRDLATAGGLAQKTKESRLETLFGVQELFASDHLEFPAGRRRSAAIESLLHCPGLWDDHAQEAGSSLCASIHFVSPETLVSSTIAEI